MPSNDRRVNRVPISKPKRRSNRIPSKIEDLFAQDDVINLLEQVNNNKPYITDLDLVVIYVDKRDKKLYYHAQPHTLVPTIVWELEVVKQDFIINSDVDEDDEE